MLRWEQTEFLLKGVYLGLLVLVAWQIPTAAAPGAICLYTVGCLGVVFYAMRYVRDRRIRMWLGLGLVIVLSGSLAAAIYARPELVSQRQLTMIGVLLLFGIPGFYLLTFASLIEESEVEIAAICA